MEKPIRVRSEIGAAGWWKRETTFGDGHGGCLKCGQKFWIRGLADHVLKCWGGLKLK